METEPSQTDKPRRRYCSHIREHLLRYILVGSVALFMVSHLYQAHAIRMAVPKTEIFSLQSTDQSHPVSARLEYPAELTEGQNSPLHLWLTSSSPIYHSYQVVFRASDPNLTFADKDGLAVESAVWMRPAQRGSGAPQSLYLKRTRQEVAAQASQVELEIEIYPDSQDQALPLEPSSTGTAATITLISATSAFLAHLLRTVFDPTTGVIAATGAITVIVIKVLEQAWTKEREQREAVGRTLNALVEIEQLYKTDKLQAAQKYCDLLKKIEPDQLGKLPFVAERLAQTGNNFLTAEWAQFITGTAITLLQEKNFEGFKDLIRLGKNLQTNPENLAALEQLRGCLDPTQAGARPPGLDRVMALLNVYTLLQAPVRQIVNASLAKLAADPAYTPVVAEVLLDSPYGRDLVLDREFNGLSRRMAETRVQAGKGCESCPRAAGKGPTCNNKNNVEKEACEAAHKIETYNEPRISWPEIWSREPQKQDDFLKLWLQQGEIDPSGYGSEFAELDPDLLRHFVALPVYDRLRAPEPGLVYAPVGGGRTAAALYLLSDYRTSSSSEINPATFPIYGRYSGEEAPLPWLLDTSGRELARFLALNPHRYLRAEHVAQVSMGLLLKAWAGGLPHLEREFQAWGLSSSETLRRMLADIDLKTQALPPGSMNSEQLFDLLSLSRPAPFRCTLLLFDFESGQLRKEALANALQQFLEWIVPLQAHGVYVKLFFPEGLQAAIPGAVNFPVMELQWSQAQIIELLERRCELAKLCARASIPDPVSELAKAARCSPRRAVRLHNRVIEAALGEKPGERLGRSLFEAILVGVDREVM